MKTIILLFVAALGISACSSPKGEEAAPGPLTREQLRRLGDFDSSLGKFDSSASSLASDLAMDDGKLPTNIGDLKPGADYASILQQYRKAGLCRGVEKNEVVEDPKLENAERSTKGKMETKSFKSIAGDECQIKFNFSKFEKKSWDEQGTLLEQQTVKEESSYSWGMTAVERKMFGTARAIESISFASSTAYDVKKELAASDITITRVGTANVSGSVTYEGQAIAIVGAGTWTTAHYEGDSLYIGSRTAHLVVQFPDFKAVIDLVEKTTADGNSTTETVVNGRLLTSSYRNLMDAAGF